jgi:hypothetical protein
MNTIMSLFCLPQVILSEIYSYDDTYNDIYVIDILSELRCESLNRWRKQFIGSLKHELSIRMDFILDYLFDIWSPYLQKNENIIQENIQFTLWSCNQYYRYWSGGREPIDQGICTQDAISNICIYLPGKPLFVGAVYSKQKYFDKFVHGYDAMNANVLMETVHNNESFYLVQTIRN